MFPSKAVLPIMGMLFASECKLMAAIFREGDKEQKYKVYIIVYAGYKDTQIHYWKNSSELLGALQLMHCSESTWKHLHDNACEMTVTFLKKEPLRKDVTWKVPTWAVSLRCNRLICPDQVVLIYKERWQNLFDSFYTDFIFYLKKYQIHPVIQACFSHVRLWGCKCSPL